MQQGWSSSLNTVEWEKWKSKGLIFDGFMDSKYPILSFTFLLLLLQGSSGTDWSIFSMLSSASLSGSNDTVECQSSEMQCGSGDCVPLSWQCDGEDDCPDGEDESTCAVLNTCSHGEFR